MTESRLGGLLARLKRHRTLASVVALALIAGVPTTIAVLHKGFPVSDVNLNAADVWVTNGAKLLGGRLNHQIDELDASVNGSSNDLDVLQNGSAYFLTDTSKGSVQKIDPAYVSLTDQITVPDDSWVGYGGNTLAILAPDGRLWSIDASNQLTFSATKTTPAARLGAGAAAVVDSAGTVFAVSPKQNELASVSHPGAAATKTAFSVSGKPQITAIGTTPVVLDHGGTRLRTPDRTLDLPGTGLQLQQPSAPSANVLVAASDRLYRSPLNGGHATALDAGGTKVADVTASEVSAPVQLQGCDYGAWAANGRYLYACDGKSPVSQTIGESVTGDDLRFRVNGNVIALNNLQNGDAWVVSQNMKLVRNWEMLEPSDTQKKQSNTGQEVPVMESFEQTLANRTAENHRPEPEDDNFGVRPGRTTVLPVLDNDQDPDGDVLTVVSTDPVPASEGKLDIIDGGRALQFTPAPGASSAAFKYTVTDGRPGGDASANVQVGVHEPGVNAAPAAQRASSVDVEANQSISYNVLQDWRDPDGDSIFLENASPTSQDNVSFTPDGDITFTNTSGQVGTKTVDFTVSDGTLKAQGMLEVNVKPKGTLPPVAVPDFTQATLGRATTVQPLANDSSPSGDPLVLDDATSPDPSVTVTVDQEQGTLSVLGNTAGTYYLTYKVSAGTSKEVEGLIRVDVIQPDDNSAPPLAVNDVAYVHPGQTTTVTPLDNDVSPSGRVLAVQQVTGGADAGAINIQLLDNTVVKITSPGVLEKQVQLSYVVSDGLKSAVGSITVVPVAPLVNFQPPVAVTDSVNVRAGDIATVDVLNNDYSPDDQPFALDPVLKSTANAGGGTAFVSGTTVRYQAPSKPGQYSVTYSISDDHQQSASADVIFNVIPTGSDQAPQPLTVTGRVFAGSTVPITVPLNGVDPDGDSVFFDGVTDSPKLGTVSGTNATGFTYHAADSGAGTDQFRYEVEDALGKTASGLIRIAVIPRPTTLQPPTAVNDKVEVRPGKTGSVQVLDNDSDPNGYPLTLEKKLDQVDPQLSDVKTDGSSVLFTAPQTEGVYSLHYTINNGHGGRASAYVQVTVSKDAKPRYPTAVDHYVSAADAKSKASVAIDALGGATDPSGPVADLTLQATGANANLATVGKDGTITVKTQDQRTIIPYQVTDPATKLTGQAFIVIPPRGIKTTPPPNADQNAASRKVTDAPRIKPGLGEQVVPMNGSKTFSFADILDVPSGRPASLSGNPTSDHGTATGSGSSFTFKPATGYRGPASVTFNVDDGKEDGASADRITTLVLPITVGSKDQSDVPPTFTTPKVQIEPGEAAKNVDLRAASYHPNPQILASLQYTGLQAMSVNGVTASLSGSTLSVQAPVTQKPGTTAVFRFTIKSANFSIPGEVDVTVTSSTRPLAQQKDPPQTHSMQRGSSYTLSDAVGSDYWINPFPDTPLTITDATAVNSPVGVSVSYTGSSITVRATSAASTSGTVSIAYHVQDATKDPTRTAQVVGQYQVTIHDVPATPSAPKVAKVGTSDTTSSTVRVSFTAPANNGLPITGYEVDSSDGSTQTVGASATSADVTVKNGTAYAFTVKAKNADGWSQTSPKSASITTYGTPATPSAPHLSDNNSGNAPAKLTATWSKVTETGGGSVSYQVSVNGGGAVDASGTSYSLSNQPAGSYSVRVRAVAQPGDRTGPWSDASNTVTLTNPPPSVTLSKGGRTGYISSGPDGYCSGNGNCYYYHITVSHFSPSSSQTIQFYCQGTINGTSRTMSVDGNGNGTYDTGTQGPAKWCGYSDAYVVVGGVSSNHEDFTG